MQRDDTIDIVKGVGITLVVLGHSGCPTWLHDFVYQFHMPLFFIASGWFFSWKKEFKDFAIRKVQTLYIPFVIWSVVFLLLHNIFFKMGILSAEYGYQGLVNGLYSWKTIIKKTIWIVTTMTQYETSLLGTFWFVRTLFIALFVLYIPMRVVERYRKDSLVALCTIGAIATLLGGWFAYSGTQWVLKPVIDYKVCMALFFIVLGCLLRRMKSYLTSAPLLILVTCIVIFTTAIYPTDMAFRGRGLADWIVLMMAGTAGFIMVYGIIIKMEQLNSVCIGKYHEAMAWIGKNSFVIMAIHPLLLKPASFLKVYLCHLPLGMVGYHPVIPENGGVLDGVFSIGYDPVNCVCGDL